MDSPTRVRFAPSPTGFLHIGGVRTALFNWLYARQTGGEFLLRIENTDTTREVAQASERIQDDLRWLDLDWDGATTFQLDRLKEHQALAERLLSEGKAYEDAGAVYLRIPEAGEVSWEDAVKGRLHFQNAAVKDSLRPRDDKSRPGDLVILRADGRPTYNFASPADDVIDGISDVIRGDDHVSNTPKQIHVIEALGARLPRYAHLPMVFDDHGKKMSKRTGATSLAELLSRQDEPMVYLEEFRAAGYLPEALLNHLALIGWSPGGEETLLSLAEAVARFRLEDVNPAAARFDYQRLEWMNGVYLRQLDPADFERRLVSFAAEANPGWDPARVAETAPLVQEKMATLAEYSSLCAFLFGPVTPDPADLDPLPLQAAREALLGLTSFDADSIAEAVKPLPKRLGIKKAGQFYRPLYAAVCGRPTGPSLFHSLPLVGRGEALARLERALELARPGHEASELSL